MSHLQFKDSGTRDAFVTGAVRDGATNKGRFDLFTFHALERVAKVFEAGAQKYEDRNWEKGIPMHRFTDSGQRHFLKYASGWRDEDHLAMAAWNALCGLETEYRIARGILPASLSTLPVPEPTYGMNTAEHIVAYAGMLA